jgi:hypothetical protein
LGLSPNKVLIKNWEQHHENKAFDNGHLPDRRSFIGGSDARIIMGDDEPALLRAFCRKSAARRRPKTFPPTSSSSLA